MGKGGVKMSAHSCAFTGHRPARFSFYENENDEMCLRIKAILRDEVNILIAKGVRAFYSGMAQAVDQWCAEIVLDIKKENPGIKLIAAIPCETQANNWAESQRERYFNILAKCDDVVTLQKHYSSTCMHDRNRYMVDHAEYLLAVYDGGAKGGTAFTVKYARQKTRKITIINPDTLAVTSE